MKLFLNRQITLQRMDQKMKLFSKATLDYLFENRMNDSKAWFEEHKSTYQTEVFAPLHDLVEALTPVMIKIDPNFTTTPRVDKTICRIRRDTRFSHDKSLYRDNMWIIFKRGKMHGTEVPGVYFEISQHGFEYGCGFYHASPAYMNALRTRILRGDKLFLQAEKALSSQNTFHLAGECYKRPRFSDQPDRLREWLERREISIIAESKDFPLLFSDKLAPMLQQEFEKLAPIYHFFLQTALENHQLTE